MSCICVLQCRGIHFVSASTSCDWILELFCRCRVFFPLYMGMYSYKTNRLDLIIFIR